MIRNRYQSRATTLVALSLAGLIGLAGCSSDSDDDNAAGKNTATTAEASADTTGAVDTTGATYTTEAAAATGPVIHAEWNNAGNPDSSDKPWSVQKAKIEGNKLTLYLYTWEPTTTTSDWPWPEPDDYGEGDFFLSVEITAPGELFQPAIYKDDQITPSLSLADLGVSFLIPNGEIQVTGIDGLVTGELRIDDGYAKVTGPFEAVLDS